MTLLHALDGWETHRRSKTSHQSGSLEKGLEQDRRRIFDVSREIILQSLELRARIPVIADEAITPSSSDDEFSLPPLHPCPPSSTNPGPSGLRYLPRDTERGLNTQTFKCSKIGCDAPPFQTEYLLSSHMAVHSNARPYFCPKSRCPRGLGGLGFKRKNEMTRLVLNAEIQTQY